MENASKALIIAGAIILAIVLITLGYNVIKNNTDLINTKGKPDQAEIEAFNAEFEGYIGKNKKASDVRSLYSKIVAKNATEEKNHSDRRVKLTINGTEQTTMPMDLSNSATYTIEIKNYDGGYISEINVQQD